jgi:hypothetical protein
VLECARKGEFGMGDENQQQRDAAQKIDPDFTLSTYVRLRDEPPSWPPHRTPLS